MKLLKRISQSVVVGAGVRNFLITFGFVVGVFLAVHGVNAAVLGVTQISAVQTFASADGTFTNGWKWIFDVTVPTNETILQMKFADWNNGTNVIPAASNIQFYSDQSSNAFDESNAVAIGVSGVYSSAIKIDPTTDLDITKAGRQIQITVEAKVPVGSFGGSYSTSYGIKSNPDPDVPVITVDVYNTVITNSDVVVTASTSTGTLNETSHTFSVNGSFDFVATGPTGILTTKTVTITNIDKIAPVIASHTNLSAIINSPSGVVVTYTSPTTSDNIDSPGTASCSPISGSSFPLGINTVTCNTTDTAGNQATPTIFTVNITETGKLSVGLDGDTPVDAIVTANTSDNSVTRIKLTSINEGFLVTRITVENTNAASSRSITSVRLFDKNGTLFCSGALDSASRLRCANDAGLFTVDGSHVVTIKLNIDQEGSGTTGANSGDSPIMALYVDKAGGFADDIKAVGVSSGSIITDADMKDQGDNGFDTASFKITSDASSGVDLVSGNQHVVRKTQPTVATIATSTTLNPNSTLYKFSITAASNADVALKRFNLSESNVGVTLGSYRVYENDTLLDTSLYQVCADASFQNGVVSCTTDLKAADTIVSDTSKTVTVVFNTERVVSAGTTKTYRIDASASGVGAGDSITHKLIDDSIASVETDNLDAITLDDDNFIWSDTSADAHSAVLGSSSADWTNGKYVKTLPTNPQTLSL